MLMRRKTRLSEIRKWRKDFIDTLEGVPVGEFVVLRRRECDGKVTKTLVHGKRLLSRKGAEKLMRIVEKTIEEKIGD